MALGTLPPSNEKCSSVLGVSRKHPDWGVQREKQLVGERVKGEVSASELKSFCQGEGRVALEVVMDPGWQESFSKCVFSSASALT